MRKHPIAKTFVLLTVSSLSLCLYAADPILSPGDTDLIRDRQERLLQEQQRKLDELQQLPGDTKLAVPELADESRCFDIKEIRLNGATHISEAQQGELLKPFVGQCLGAAGIDALIKTIGRYYMERGYVTSRAYLPKQDLNSGVLQLTVIEGKLEGFEPSALAFPREIAMTFPGKTGETLDLRKLEQQAEQLGRLPWPMTTAISAKIAATAITTARCPAMRWNLICAASIVSPQSAPPIH